MAANVLVDTSFLVALIDRRDPNHGWASTQPGRWPPPWQTCEAVLSETFHLLGATNAQLLIGLMRGNALVTSGLMERGDQEVLDLMEKYAAVPMSFADACLVRMTEIFPEPTLLTTDSDFRIYRRLGRRTIPTAMPQD
jgi:predicted nucleic acid-binding protein